MPALVWSLLLLAAVLLLPAWLVGAAVLGAALGLWVGGRLWRCSKGRRRAASPGAHGPAPRLRRAHLRLVR